MYCDTGRWQIIDYPPPDTGSVVFKSWTGLICWALGSHFLAPVNRVNSGEMSFKGMSQRAKRFQVKGQLRSEFH